MARAICGVMPRIVVKVLSSAVWMLTRSSPAAFKFCTVESTVKMSRPAQIRAVHGTGERKVGSFAAASNPFWCVSRPSRSSGVTPRTMSNSRTV